MSNIRQERVAELLFEEMSIMVANELDDPKLSLVTVTNVVVSRDLRSARIYVNHQQEDVSRQEVIKRLQHAIPYLRRQIAERCSLRVVPELSFSYDDMPTKAARVSELLQQLAREREPQSSTSPTEAIAESG
jgi:ribosome-binding factor A